MSKGFKVTVANDEYPEGTIGKILGKLHVPILMPLTEYVISKKYLKNKKYDLILIIKGRGIGKVLMQKLRGCSNRVIGFTWDSFRYNKAPLRWYRYATKFYTFDYRDADNFKIPVVELFSSLPSQKEEKKIEHNISAIFRNHSGRLKYLDKVLGILDPPRKFIYIYEQNIFFFLINFFSHPFLYFKYLNFIHIKPLQYDIYFQKLEASKFTLDYAHPSQSGITIRSFEALSKKTMIISNNPYMQRSAFFNNSNTIYFSENDNPEKLLSSYDLLKSSNPEFKIRSISDFIDDLISN
jgi:hypothetical protein